MKNKERLSTHSPQSKHHLEKPLLTIIEVVAGGNQRCKVEIRGDLKEIYIFRADWHLLPRWYERAPGEQMLY